MKTPLGLSILLALIISSPSLAQESAPGDEPAASEPVPPAVPDDIGIGNTSVGDETDLGTPDPLNALDAPPPDVQPMPDFQDVPSENATTPGPSEMAPTETVETPAPVSEPVLTPEPDTPDFRREKNFHSIYKRFNENPTPAEQWEQASNARQSQSYKVQKGDTLWDLSSTLFGQADYWPKIWALNKDEVTNPHQIETWMQIRFYPGSLMDAPTLAVTENTPTNLAAGEALPPGDAALIPPARPRAAVVRQIPSSLPLHRTQVRLDPVTNFEGLKPPAPLAKPNAPLSYYITENEIPQAGAIKEAEMGGMTASEYQYVYVELNDPSVRVLTAVREVGTIMHNQAKGRIVEVQGEIEVVDSAGENGLYRAIVRRNLSPIEVGALLIPNRIESVNTVDASPVAGPAVEVVGAQFAAGRNMADAEGIVFLSGGRDAGVQEGQVYAIFSKRQLRVPGSRVVNSGEIAGHVRVAKVSDRFATAFVTMLHSEILVGDMVGAPASAMPSPTAIQNDDEEFSESSPRASAPTNSNADDFEVDSDFESLPSQPAESGGESAPAESNDSEFDEFSL